MIVSENFNFRQNNLNFIRLFAAFQVLIGHLHVCFNMPDCIKYISLFNGVPIFFTISGFLIFWSFDNKPNIKTFFINRFLRIFPALIFSLIFTIILLFSFNIISIETLKNSSFYLWIIAQLTFMQEFTPYIMKGFGGEGNVPNPVLWTISVEMLLYFSIPLLYFVIERFSKKVKTLIILFLGIISYIQNQTGFIGDLLFSLSDNAYYSILIWPFTQLFSFYFFFCVGIIIYLYKEKIIPFLKNKVFIILFLYLVISIILYILDMEPGSYSPNIWELISHFILVLLIFSVAYTRPYMTDKYMGKTDISYGLYIYHILILHSFIELGFTSIWYILPYIFICLFIARISWKFIESPALKLKKNSLFKTLLNN